MRYKDAVEIERLAAILVDKREAFYAFLLLNMAGLNHEELRQQEVKYQLAKTELAIAEAELQRAQVKATGGA